MTQLIINDLEMNREMDRDAMSKIKGGVFSYVDYGTVKELKMSVFGTTYTYTTAGPYSYFS